MREILKNNGLDDSKIEAILNEMKEAKIYTSKNENIDERYSKLKAQKTDLETQLKDRDNQLKDLSKNNKDNEHTKSNHRTHPQRQIPSRGFAEGRRPEPQGADAVRRSQMCRTDHTGHAPQAEHHGQDAGDHRRGRSGHAGSTGRKPLPQLQRILQRAVQDTRRPECRKPRHRPDAGEILRHHRHAAHDRTRGT